MIDDDLTPNDSEALGVYEPEVPQEVIEDDRKEVNRVAIAQAVAEDVVGWFESMLADYETVDSVNKTKNTYKISTDEAFAAHHLISGEITNMLTKFKARFTKPEDDR